MNFHFNQAISVEDGVFTHYGLFTI